MDGRALERFAYEARTQLKEQIGAKLNYILRGDDSVELIENRKAINEINQILSEVNVEALIEEVAYTWFNRILALRYMDARGFNSTMIVSPTHGKLLPEILSDALSGIVDDSILAPSQSARIKGLLSGVITSSNSQADIYRILLVASCNALNSSIPLLFEKINDYTDLLLPDDLLSSESIISKAVNVLTIEDCENSVEIIGWLYQYYISEKKDEVMASFKKGMKAGKDEIPAATQLFTPEWIVRYLVENSVGRLWMLNNPTSNLKYKMKYYTAPSVEEIDFIKISKPEDIKVLDPCCGSGHMLTYAFDLLYEIYHECGYSDNDAVENIIRNNLYGIEIDKRAGQLAYFALMMKAREKSRRFFRKEIKPNICIIEKVVFDTTELSRVQNLFNKPIHNLIELVRQFEHADVLGSLIIPTIDNISAIKENLKKSSTDNIFAEENTLKSRVKIVLNQAEYLSSKYNIVITNPPYLSPSSADSILQVFAKTKYPFSKSDMGTMFIERNFEFLARKSGYVAMITLQGWMFLSSYEKLRHEILDKRSILSMIHIGARGFDSIGGEVVSTSAYVLNSKKIDVKGQYVRLVDGQSEEEKSKALRRAINDHNCGYYFEIQSTQFEKITGSPIAYWIPKSFFIRYFSSIKTMQSVSESRLGLVTGQNDKYLRLWFEVPLNKVGFNCTRQSAIESEKKWFPCDKGGSFRKWYGNREYVVNWYNDGYEIQHEMHPNGARTRAHNFNLEYNFIPHISWSAITTGHLAFRVFEDGFIFVSASGVCFSDIQFEFLAGYLNSNIVDYISTILNPTINFKIGDYFNIPYPESLETQKDVFNYAKKNIQVSKSNWDSFETSWDFSIHPLIDSKIIQNENSFLKEDTELVEYLGYDNYIKKFKVEIDDSFCLCPIELAYLRYKDWTNKAFFHMKKNEEELNKIFIDMFGLQNELVPQEDESMVSVHRIFDTKSEIPESMKKGQYALTKEDVIKSFISYSVGCMFGRYNPHSKGLAYAGGEWDLSNFDSSFMPDDDNVIPILEDSWFENDAERYFIRFLGGVYGNDTLNANLKFIENALGMSVRKYFAKYFYADHLKTYQKRPIYWMFSSPKGYFQVLVYIHRYNENTANIVLKYLRDFREKIQVQVKMAEEAGETKKALEYQNIDKDLNDYEMNTLYPLATRHLTFDLDDGVKVNYQKLGNALKPIK